MSVEVQTTSITPHRVMTIEDIFIKKVCRQKVFFYVHLGYPLNFIFVFQCHVKGAYLCLAEV